MKRLLAFFLVFAVSSPSAIAAPPSTAGVDYATQIKPILAARCYACHSALRKKSGLRVDTAAALVAGGDAGPGIVPGKSGESYLIEMLTGESGSRMPPEDDGAALPAEQIELFKRWIDEGAHAPVETPQPDPRDHWSYHAPVRPDVPGAKNSSWVRNPIDAFIASGHEAKGLAPVPEADRATLLRRVTLDLTGLPPTREELAAFVANDAPTAYDEVVDRLLASPQHGERWARHWMDVWRYSDWYGYKQQIRNSAKHIWRWRDWIVESLNADKGYDRMATEMLAGDELAPGDPDTLRATGFLVRNWFLYNRDVWLESTVEHTAKAFLGATMNCCKCHDHKFDPISQAEYFHFRAIFEPHDVYTDRVPGETNVAKDGLARICDLKPDAPTYLFERGDAASPKKEQSLGPGTPECFGEEMKIESVNLPTIAFYPALQQFAIDDERKQAMGRIANAEQALLTAQRVVADLQKPPAAPETLVAQSTAGVGEATTGAEPGAHAQPAAEPAGKKKRAAKKEARPATLEEAVAAAEVATQQLATARAAFESLDARVAAEKAKYGLVAEADQQQLALTASKAERNLALCQAQEKHQAAAKARAAAKAALKPDDAATAAAVAAAEKVVAEAAAALAGAHGALAEVSMSYQPLGTLLPQQSTGRRLAFAKWLTDRQNPLAARVAINHIWTRHFGAPLVDNMFDFGLRTAAPRNQALLDWLAVELMEHNWQMKHIHRLIVTSSTYRMSSSSHATSEALAKNIEIDLDNHYLWRMNTRRMEAELVRDAVFFTAGNLDLARGGPDIPFALATTTPRRSIYFTHAEEKTNLLLQVFDSASVNECYRRSESVVPQQALAMANSEVSVNESRLLAKKLSELVAADSAPTGSLEERKFVELAFEQILNRAPSDDEISECEKFIEAQASLLKDVTKLIAVAGGAKATVPPSTDPLQRARENLTLVLFNHNDFITIR